MPKPALFQRLTRALAVLAAALPLCIGAAPQLPALGVDLGQTTVSGVSSGAYMAEQFAVAYSSTVSGVGMIAGGPYFCAGEPESNPPLWNAFSRCMNPAAAGLDAPDAAVLWARAQGFAAQGQIDAVTGIRHQRVFLFSGIQDEVVTKVVMAQTRRFYELAQAASITYVNNVQAGHGMITARPQDSACQSNMPPYFNNCGRTLAGELLAALYDGVVPAPAGQRVEGSIVRFDQRRYAAASSGLAAEGYAFIPSACRRAACRVHVAFHGCFQTVNAVEDHFYRYAGYNETAAANRIVVLYPQVAPTTLPYNPLGCWDYWGYSSSVFYGRAGPQAAAVRAMLARLAQRRPVRVRHR